MIVAFELSMPSVASWNGRWRGEGNLYAIVRSVPAMKGAEIVQQRRYTYAFGDGWVAAVTAREVTRSEAAKLRRNTRGFCGYDWMVESILRRGAITAD